MGVGEDIIVLRHLVDREFVAQPIAESTSDPTLVAIDPNGPQPQGLDRPTRPEELSLGGRTDAMAVGEEEVELCAELIGESQLRAEMTQFDLRGRVSPVC